MNDIISKKLNDLSKSRFRESFHLKKVDKEYIKAKGLAKVREHAYGFIDKRLKPAIIPNDGKQTPMRNHPVFIAQHACACCCRSCLYKWHQIPINRELSGREVDYIVDLLMTWIKKEYNNK